MRFILVLTICSLALLFAEDTALNVEWQGQVSVFHASSFEDSFSESPTTLRYIPQLRLDCQSSSTTRFGFDAALDLYNHTLGDSLADMAGELYRLTLRYDTPNTQVRVGLQKINFGPARMLRVLQWFDQLDARDPLSLSPGVWAAMGRYYFNNGANIRLWTMVDAPDTRRDSYHLSNKWPWDVGGRLEVPIPAGTLGLTVHSLSVLHEEFIKEQWAAFDLRVDAVVGLWTEVMYRHSNDLVLKDVVTSMAGVDYTIGLGNGLYVALETLSNHMGNGEGEMLWIGGSTAFMASYTLGLADGLTSYLYAINRPDIDTQYVPMLGWQHTRGNWLYYVAFYDMPVMAMGGTLTLPAGTGIQLNIAFNH